MIKPILLDALDTMIRRRLNADQSVVKHGADRSLATGPLPMEVHAAMLDSLDGSLRKLHDALATLVTDMVPAASNGWQVRVGAELHSIRGAFAMIHAADIADACAHLEQLLREESFSSLAAGIDELDANSSAVLKQRSP